MLKKTKFYVGMSLIAQSITFISAAIVLIVKNKSWWKTFLTLGLVGGGVGGFLTFSALKEDKRFKKLIAAMDDFCSDSYQSTKEIPVDDTATEEEFEGM